MFKNTSLAHHKRLWPSRLCSVAAVTALCVYSTVTTASDIIPGGINDHLRLGMPFHMDEQEARYFDCIVGKPDPEEDLEIIRATSETNTNMSYLETLKEISGRVQGEAVMSGIKLKGSAWFSQHVASTSIDKVWLKTYRIQGGTRTLLPDETSGGYHLTPTCEGYAATYNSTDGNGQIVIDPNILDKVGTGWVSHITYGGRLFVAVKASFASKEDKEIYGGDIKFDAGAISVEGGLELKSDEFKKSVSISISAMQQGGNPTSLTQVLPEGSLTCSVFDLDECANFVAQNEGEQDYFSTFGKQFKNDDDAIEFSRMNVLNYRISSYKDTLGDPQIKLAATSSISVEAKAEIQLTRSDLESRLETDEEELREFERIEKKAGFYETDDWINTLKNNRVLAQKNLYLTMHLLEQCYDNPKTLTCVEQFKYAEDTSKACSDKTEDGTCLWASYNEIEVESKDVSDATIILTADSDYNATNNEYEIDLLWNNTATGYCIASFNDDNGATNQYFLLTADGSETKILLADSYNNTTYPMTVSCDTFTGIQDQVFNLYLNKVDPIVLNFTNAEDTNLGSFDSQAPSTLSAFSTAFNAVKGSEELTLTFSIEAPSFCSLEMLNILGGTETITQASPGVFTIPTHLSPITTKTHYVSGTAVYFLTKELPAAPVDSLRLTCGDSVNQQTWTIGG